MGDRLPDERRALALRVPHPLGRQARPSSTVGHPVTARDALCLSALTAAFTTLALVAYAHHEVVAPVVGVGGSVAICVLALAAAGRWCWRELVKPHLDDLPPSIRTRLENR